MDPNCSVSSAGGENPAKSTRNVITPKKKFDVINRVGCRESAVSVTILSSVRRDNMHRFLCFGGRRLCYLLLTISCIVSGFWFQ